MERIFTKDVGRFKSGDLRDYAKGVWTQIERNVRKPLDSFTKPADDAAKESLKTKTPR